MNASSQRWASRVSSAAFHSANASSTHGSVNVGSLVPTPETTSPATRSGCSRARSTAVPPPIERPTTVAGPRSRAWKTAAKSSQCRYAAVAVDDSP